ncbi:glycosyltransferase family 4 protein [Actinomyces provencensis]|uniref:glycosyltransferase family 4 protein n=1 Tax=Actinomyces provencensis TaxID=1720198 RepID=UPI00096A7288|nr:glycosyltransferase family 4 protein [Actinomyces provencensis]
MSQRPRVVIATRIYAPEVAAAAFRLTAVARSLGRAGAQVRVLTSRPAGTRSVEEESGLRVLRARTLRGRDGYLRGYAQYLSFDLPLFFRLLEMHPRPDVIVAEPPPTTGAVVRVVAALRHVPYVHYAADVWSDAAVSMDVPRPVVAGLRMVERFVLRGASRVIAVSDGVAQRVRELGARDVRVVPNGIDTEVFAPQGGTHREDPATSPDTPPPPGSSEQMPEHFLVYAGTASEWQGAGVFVDAFRELGATHPHLHLVFMGQGTALPSIWDRAGGDPRIHFIGQRPAVEAARWQAAAEVALVSVVPGKGYDFAYPTKVLAALACGTPVVFAGVGPVVEDITGADLGAVADHEPGAVAEAIRDVLDRPRDRGHLRAWVLEHRSLDTTGRRAAEIVLGALTGSR